MQPFAAVRFPATEPIDPDGYHQFFATAPFLSHIQYDYPYPISEVWPVISGDRMWSWLPTVWGCRYPAGEIKRGVVRDFQMYLHHWMVYAQHEKILHWEPGRRLVYTATDATLPFFGSWCEEYAIEPIDSGRGTRLRWTLAVKLRFIGWLPQRWVAAILKPVFKFGLRALVRELEHGPTGVFSEAPSSATR